MTRPRGAPGPHRGRRPRTALAPGAAELAAAAGIVAAVQSGRSADAALGALGELGADARAVRAIAFGTLRWYLRLLPAVLSLLARPAGDTAARLQALLVVAVHQLEYSRHPPEVTVHCAVDAARACGLEHATGLVNAVLRRFLRERGALLAAGDRDLAVRTAHPAWLVAALDAAWPGSIERVLDANNAHPPLTLRVDLTRGSRAAYLEQLRAAELPGRACEWCPTAVIVDHPVPVDQLPGFAAGLVSVQDVAAQLAAPLLDARPGMRVLDACAAPGGKTGHLLEHTRGLAQLIATDHDPVRLARVEDNLRRLGRVGEAQCVIADLRRPEALGALGLFDRILLDAPCSATGVIRRHPDIKLLRRSTDIAAYADIQRELLAATFAQLAPGGRLLYATCSVLPAEGEEPVARFLRETPAARLAAVPAGVMLPDAVIHGGAGLRLLPDAAAANDGFHYACIERTTIAMRS
jgi:16S rRNA (cytosine967-C5)-methyltransferase